MYAIQQKETGTVIDKYDTIEQAKKALKFFEEVDESEGIFEPEFYEIVETED
jgi:hypothetical protein